MIIDLISDLHGFYPNLSDGDLLIVAGDLTGRDTEKQHAEFAYWLEKQEYLKKIVIAGNHDNLMQNVGKFYAEKMFPDAIYLEDSGTEFEGLKIWGSPWSKTFEGMNPHCKAFTCDTEEKLSEKWALIPDDIDILITHSPPYGILDLVEKISFDKPNDHKFKGSISLRNKVLSEFRKIHVFGHIHECGGHMIDTFGCKFINASHVNEKYEPVNKPIRLIL